MNCQFVDWYGEDTRSEEHKKKMYTVYGMGLTDTGESITIKVNEFKPYFYISIPEEWTIKVCCRFLKMIKDSKKEDNKPRIPYWLANDICDKKIVQHCIFKNFTNNKQFKFLKLVFHTKNAMTTYARVIKNLMDESHDPCYTKIELYEDRLDPLLRFFHETNIKPSGWVKVDITSNIEDDTEKKFDTLYEVPLTTNDIKPVDLNKIAPMKVASFDIECHSSHGDFPLAQKDLRKLICEVHAEFNRTRINEESDEHFEKYESMIMYITNLIYSAFDIDNESFFGLPGEHNISKVYFKKKQSITHTQIQNIVEDVMPNQDTVAGFCEIKGPKKEALINRLIGSDTIYWKDEDGNKLKDKSGREVSPYYFRTYKTYGDLEDWIIDKFNMKRKWNEKKTGLLSLNIEVKGDPVIQIGMVFYTLGQKIETIKRTIVTLKNCNKKIIDNCDDDDIYCYDSEEEVLKKWAQLIKEENPQYITGYNIFGFDFKYIFDRAKELDILEDPEFYDMGVDHRDPDNSDKCKLTTKELSSSALGDNMLYFIEMKGRVLFDLQKEVQKEYNLSSYKLDNVASEFMRGNLSDLRHVSSQPNKKKEVFTKFTTDNIGTLKKGKFIKIVGKNNIGEQLYNNGEKYMIYKINEENNWIYIKGINIKFQEDSSYKWCEAKDDISPADIFRKQDEDDNGRAEIAKYCIQDCELCIHLMNRFETVSRNISMGNVCYVPTSYIFLRGQGVKIFSLVVKTANLLPKGIGTLIPTRHTKFTNDDEIEDGYERDAFEGAIVLEPSGKGKGGGDIYTDRPISVLDFASLYPSSMCERNLSHETIVTEEMLLKESDKYKIEDQKSKFTKLEYTDNDKTITFDNVIRIDYDNYYFKYEKKTWKKYPAYTKTVCWFVMVEKTDEEMKQDDTSGKYKMGIIPYVVDTLLKQRKATKKELKNEKNPERKKILDGQQLAYKLTANSTYGQIGARTSQLYYQEIAACTTATGREHIITAKQVIEEEYPGCKVVYGDTDSIFVDFTDWVHNNKMSPYYGKGLVDKELLGACIKTADAADKVFIDKKIYNSPQHLEYEKTFWPFIQVTKKRYTGDKYEFDVNESSRTSMGLVTKRRDNAPIVKYIFGTIVEIIMKDKNVEKAVDWMKKALMEIARGEKPMDMFIISKTLRGHYKNPMGIAHKVLADRMGDRDPGNKPSSNDRIPYAYIECAEAQEKAKKDKKSFLQGDHIEHPEYIKEKELKIDYAFYITNQIQLPVSQILELKYTEEEVEEMFNEVLDYLNPGIKYARMPIGNIKKLCIEKRLISKGLKIQLIKHLLNPDNPDFKDHTNPLEVGYKKKKMVELKELCEGKGLDKKGKKDELIKRLLDAQ